MARRAFYSFHYKPDASRAGQVRNIGVVEGNTPVSDNDWETVLKQGVAAIKKWIADQMHGRSCTVVLVGSNPFDNITHGASGKKLSSIVRCYTPAGNDSKERYAWIKKHLANAVEEAITIRNDN